MILIYYLYLNFKRICYNNCLHANTCKNINMGNIWYIVTLFFFTIDTNIYVHVDAYYYSFQIHGPMSLIHA